MSEKRLLLFGSVVGLAALGVFGGLATEVGATDGQIAIDQRLAAELHEHAREQPALRSAFLVVTESASLYTMIALGCLIAVVLAVRGHYLLLAGWVLVMAGGGLVNWVLKEAYHRQRPVFEDPFVHEDPLTSFPSGHSMASVFAYGMLAYLLVLLLPRRQALAALPALMLLVLLIGFSRMYLGAHYLSDVLGGFAMGTGWLVVFIMVLEMLRRRPRRQDGGAPVL
jgi:undecaprenyl-diphosphatase